ncbi:hypothetical protein FJU08_04140 [Martelella alba]|uniref:Uncharacterized protein n=1 Tax=Martelella alba TaxID=2590451 RepID=A0A506UGI3_9HYPH|nr:hypothetical protein [Martelella alba]TPW32209.1 hypothetical protein FJU08_04140 [Martelella alba]
MIGIRDITNEYNQVTTSGEPPPAELPPSDIHQRRNAGQPLQRANLPREASVYARHGTPEVSMSRRDNIVTTQPGYINSSTSTSSISSTDSASQTDAANAVAVQTLRDIEAAVSADNTIAERMTEEIENGVFRTALRQIGSKPKRLFRDHNFGLVQLGYAPAVASILPGLNGWTKIALQLQGQIRKDDDQNLKLDWAAYVHDEIGSNTAFGDYFRASAMTIDQIGFGGTAKLIDGKLISENLHMRREWLGRGDLTHPYGTVTAEAQGINGNKKPLHLPVGCSAGGEAGSVSIWDLRVNGKCVADSRAPKAFAAWSVGTVAGGALSMLVDPQAGIASHSRFIGSALCRTVAFLPSYLEHIAGTKFMGPFHCAPDRTETWANVPALGPADTSYAFGKNNNFVATCFLRLNFNPGTQPTTTRHRAVPIRQQSPDPTAQPHREGTELRRRRGYRLADDRFTQRVPIANEPTGLTRNAHSSPQSLSAAALQWRRDQSDPELTGFTPFGDTGARQNAEQSRSTRPRLDVPAADKAVPSTSGMQNTISDPSRF